MDGVDQLNNILIIGMTNRKDLIDEALLRAGRLEVHVEISLPDEAGRLQILNIHTTSMRQGGLMDKDVDLKEIAAQTKNFSGAEIRGLVNSASSFAFTRHVKVGSLFVHIDGRRVLIIHCYTRSAPALASQTMSTTLKSIGQTSSMLLRKSSLSLVFQKRSYRKWYKTVLSTSPAPST
jgi:SpoVK/Ycf46/Vps4 family AAA+-type ATPase